MCRGLFSTLAGPMVRTISSSLVKSETKDKEVGASFEFTGTMGTKLLDLYST